MLLILFGTKDRRKEEGEGQFICPRCGVERDYEVISLREWFTLFFIPILPTANNEGKEAFVECKTCKKAYDTDVLVKLKRK
jgi:transcription elongation factor Elf1